MPFLRLLAPLAIAVTLASCGSDSGSGDDGSSEANVGPPPLFREMTEALGLDVVHDLVFSGEYHLPEITGSGVAVFDADGDGDLDIYLVNAGRTRGDGAANVLLIREGDGYVDRTQERGGGDAGYGMGASVGDIDNDGDLDLYVSNWGTDTLYRNDGGRFVDVTAEAGIRGDLWSTSVAMVDYDLDGHLDIYVAHFVDYVSSRRCPNEAGEPDYCGPNTFNGVPDTLYRNLGGGRFEDVSGAAGISRARGNGLGVTVDDFDGDGLPDIYVANDSVANQLWINTGRGGFVDEGMTLGCSVNGLGAAEAGMGVAAGDVDGNGHVDLFMTHLRGESNTLYLNDGMGFTDATTSKGLHGPSLTYTGFGTALFDADHDGDLDIAVANGRVYKAERLPGVEIDGPWGRYAEPNQLFLNDGSGRFTEVSSRCGGFHATLEVSRGLAVIDLDDDGDLDILVVNARGRLRAYENLAASGHWLGIRVVDPKLKREAFGARVTVVAGGRTQVRMQGSAASYLTSWVGPVHFGLGAATTVDVVRVLWPGGAEETFDVDGVDRVVTLTRGAGR